ncbi:MAG: DUF2306 domain-containing protein [Devosia sp.]|nr:DUF2306 domain-containing protein [Devosia sp.]
MTLDPLFHASPVIQIHAACAVLALLLGAVQFFRKKGDPIHRAIGRTWVGLMAIVALSGFFIWTIRLLYVFSPIHLLSIFVLVMLWRGVQAARRGDIDKHLQTMRGTYIFGLIVTGLLTLIPGRTMYFVVFGPAGATPAKLAVFGLALVVVAGAGRLIMRWRRTGPGQAFVAAH